MSQHSTSAVGRHNYPPTITARPPFLSLIQAQPLSAVPMHPTAAASSSSASSSSSSGLSRYLIHSRSQSVGDLRLQVSLDADPSTPTQEKGDGRLEPVWYRERFLSHNNEIVDQLVDCGSSNVSWSIHRPTRGWYLHLRSPLLPRGTAVPLRSANARDDDQSVTPLTFNLRTRIKRDALSRTRPSLDREALSDSASHQGSASPPGGSVVPRQGAELARPSSLPNGKAKREGRRVPGPSSNATEGRATGRSDTLHTGHARKRSTAGSGTHHYGPRKASGRSELVVGSPTIGEHDEGELYTAARGTSNGTSRLTGTTVRAPRSPHADRPYSPAEPRGFDSGPLSRRSTLQQTGKGRLWEQGSMDCTFVLCDGARRPFLAKGGASRDDTQPHVASEVALAGKQGWARWAWNLVPRDLRPALPLDTDKSFSLWWLDPPLLDDGDNSGVVPIEVLRFTDQSGWWLWDVGTRGGLTVQEKVVEAIGLQNEFWIATALAYLDFLETKDGYEAAKEG